MENLSPITNTEGDLRVQFPQVSESAVPRQWVESRGSGDLVTNGTGYLLSNYNWNNGTVVFQPADAPAGATGSFEAGTPGISRTIFSDEFVPVVASNKYLIQFMARQATPGARGRLYTGFSCYDAFKQQISVYSYYFRPGTTTTLAQPLNPGDTSIHLTDAPSAWYQPNGTANHYASIIFWNYTDPNGRVWPPETYSREFGAAIYSQNPDVAGKRIVLDAPWSGKAYPAGHPVSNTQSGGTFNYVGAGNHVVPEVWTAYSGVIGGEGKAPESFRPGTAFIKMLLLIDREDANSKHRWSGVSLRQISDGSDHDHDGRYYTEAETDSLIASHGHDDLYVKTAGTSPMSGRMNIGGVGGTSTPFRFQHNTAGRKNWVQHLPASDSMIFAPSKSADAEDWDWAKGVVLQADGTITTGVPATEPNQLVRKNEMDAELSGKANTSHAHPTSDVTGLDTALAGKAPASHTHPYLPLAGGTMTGRVAFDMAAGSDRIIAAGPAADPQYRITVNSDGEISLGDGATARDTSMYRSAAGELTVNSKVRTNQVRPLWNPLKLSDEAGTAKMEVSSGGTTLFGNLNANWYTIDTVWHLTAQEIGGIPSVNGGDIALKNAINTDGNLLYNLPLPTNPGDAVNKDYVDNIGGQSAHGSLGGLHLDQHLQYAPIHVVDAAAPAPTGHQRPGQIVVRTGTDAPEGVDFLQKQGGQMSGPLLLQGDPSNALEAASKSYVDARLVNGVWSGTLTFAAGWANVPNIAVPQSPAGTLWSPTATAHDTHNGRAWVVTVTATSATHVHLRVWNMHDAAFSGSQAMSVHWHASPVVS